jgi:hypothetical protein
VAQTLPNSPAPASLTPAKRIFDVPAPVRLWHLASLDAPTVAVVWSLAFAWTFGVRLPAWLPMLLGLVAWAVYIGDRLLDGSTAIGTGTLHALPERHRFHQRHRALLISAAIGAALVAALIVATLMPAAARERNSALALAALAYFIRVHIPVGRTLPHPIAGQAPIQQAKALPAKELLVGLIFTTACVLPSVNRIPAQPLAQKICMATVCVGFAFLAWLNCHFIDRWEDPAHAQYTGIPLPAYLLGVAMLLAGLSIAPMGARLAGMLIAGAISALLIAILDVMRHRLTPVALRAAADLVLLTPLMLVIHMVLIMHLVLLTHLVLLAPAGFLTT